MAKDDNYKILTNYIGYGHASSFENTFKTTGKTISRWISGETQVPNYAVEIIRLNNRLKEAEGETYKYKDELENIKYKLERYKQCQEDLFNV